MTNDGWIFVGITDPNCDDRCTLQDVPYRRCQIEGEHTHRKLVHIEVDHPAPFVFTPKEN